MLRQVKDKRGIHLTQVSAEHAPTSSLAEVAAASLARHQPPTPPAGSAVPARHYLPDGRVEWMEIGGTRATFRYNDRQLPEWVEYGDNTYRIVFGELGRIEALEFPDGREIRWIYNHAGLLDSKRETLPRADRPPFVRTTKWRYKKDRRLERVTYADGTYTAATYTCAGIERFRSREGSEASFKYRHGRLTYRQDGASAERYRYRKSDGLLERRQRKLGETVYTTRYLYDPEQRCFAVVSDDPSLPPIGSKPFRRVRELSLDGSYTDAIYDARGALVHLASSDGKTVHYQHAEDGALLDTIINPVAHSTHH